MESKKSLNIMIAVFMFFLGLSTIRIIELVYIPLKSSIAEQNIPAIWIYATEFVGIFIIGYAVTKITDNVKRQNFFIKQNHRLFHLMGITVFAPAFIHEIGSLVDSSNNWKAFEMNTPLWFAAGIFLFIIAEIFRYGTKLKEEQDLTV